MTTQVPSPSLDSRDVENIVITPGQLRRRARRLGLRLQRRGEKYRFFRSEEWYTETSSDLAELDQFLRRLEGR